MKKIFWAIILYLIYMPLTTYAAAELSCYYESDSWSYSNMAIIQDAKGNKKIYEAHSEDLPNDTKKWHESKAWSDSYYTYSKIVFDGTEYDIDEYELTKCPKNIFPDTVNYWDWDEFRLSAYHTIIIDTDKDTLTLVNEQSTSSTDNYIKEFKGDYTEEIKSTEWTKVCEYGDIDDETSEELYHISLYFNDATYILDGNVNTSNIYGDFSLKELLTKAGSKNKCPSKLYVQNQDLEGYKAFRYNINDEYNCFASALTNIYCGELDLLQEINGKDIKNDSTNSIPNIEKMNCTSLLGSPKTDGTPAYYLKIIFKVLKYVSIIILIVLTSLDFVQAVAAHDNDSIKKATNKALKRLILCVIIFVLPTLIEFVLQFIDTSTIDTCGIG